MSFSCEKEFIKRNYYELSNPMRLNNHLSSLKRVFTYCKKYNEIACITLDYDEMVNKWYFSYPMKNQTINYKVTFDSKEELTNYINIIINSSMLE